MRILKTIIMCLSILVSVATMAQEEKKEQKAKGLTTVVLNSNIKCNNCKARIEKNIPYEKGVKDLKVDIEKKTVTITFKSEKNTSEALCDAVTKLGYKSIIISEEKK